MTNKLMEKLEQQVLIFDGAIGTEIYNRNFFVNVSYDALSLSNPEIIKNIHSSYVEAGADVITTNTYGANRHSLSKFGLGDKVKEINLASVKLAKEGASEGVLLAGSIGPIGKPQPEIGLTKDKIIEILVEQISILAESEVDFIMFETLISTQDIEFAISAINQFKNVPYVLSCSVNRNGELIKGQSYIDGISYIQNAKNKPTALGFNCSEGPEGMLSSIELLVPQLDYPIIAQPNAGYPKVIEGRSIYMSSPEYLSTYATKFINLGVRGVGGCCGTTPDHTNDLARTIKPLAKSEYKSELIISVNKEDFLPETPMKEKSKFAAKLANNEWVTTVEITPPRGYDLTSTIEKSIQCREAGIDAINIPDGPRASSRISPIITALNILEKAEIEPILHFCCRDKNLIGMQADILGCAAAQINNILFITGDPPKLGDYPFASAVFDVDSIGMVKIQDRLNRGVDIGSKTLTKGTKTLIGVGVDPNAIDIKREIRRTKEKVENGAEYIISQPVFSIEPLLEFLDNIKDFHIPFIAGIWPLASFRNAEFMKNEVPGVVVPDNVMIRMSKYEKKEDQCKEGIDIAKENIEKIRNSVQGIQVSAPFGNVTTAINVIK